MNRRTLLGIVVSVFTLWLAVRDIPFSEFWEQVQHANYFWLIPGIVCVVAATMLRGPRWAVLLNKQITKVDGFWAFSLGNLFNNILPLRMGDAVRILVLRDKTGLSLTQITASVVVERLLDILMLVLFFAGILPFMNVPDFAVESGLMFASVAILGLGTLFLMVRYQEIGYRILLFFVDHLNFLPRERIIGRWQSGVRGLQPIVNLRLATEALVYSFLGWVASIGFYYFVLVAFGSQSPVIESIFLVVAISLAISLPSSPGFIGVFHLAGQQALVQPFGNAYTDSTAFSVVLVAYIVFYCTSSIIGGLGLLHFGRRFFALNKQVTNQANVKSV